jgi:uncharacterized protein (DUF2252 family)
MKDIPARIKIFNKRLISELLPYKFEAMRENPFRFYRGTCHLFYEDFQQTSSLIGTPSVWLCGDMHLENFGTFKGDNGLVYFDINDFDEAILGPVAWDICRWMVSVHLACKVLNFTDKDADYFIFLFLQYYTDSLKSGHAGTIENATSGGIVKTLLKSLKSRNFKDVVNQYTIKENGSRRFINDGQHLILTSEKRKERANRIVQKWEMKSGQAAKFKILDASLRIAGTGSIGSERYLLLLKSMVKKGQKILLDIKKATPSSAMPYCIVKQPKWENEAERVKEIQKRMQFTSVALLQSVEFGHDSYTIKDFQLPEDRMDFMMLAEKKADFELLVTEMAKVTAWAQIRSSGRQGSSITDELIAFGNKKKWQQEAIAYSRHYYEQVTKDYFEYKAAYDDGEFKRKISSEN